MIDALLNFLPLKRFRNPDPVVSVLRLHGVIGRVGAIGSGGLTQSGLEKTIEKAFSIKRLKAVALSVNSPGGSPVQSSLIAGHIRALSAEKDIPVYAFVEDVAASGGYWLACAADEIFADENSIIGSIGVISSGFGFVEAIKKIGVERRVHSAGKSKAILDPFQLEKPEEVEKLTSLQNEIHESFKNYVKDRRGEKLKSEGEELFEGDIWTGKSAEGLGLIDGLGDLRTVMKKRLGEKTKFKLVGNKPSPFKRFLGRGEARLYQKTLVLFSALEEWSVWKRFGL